MMDGDALYRDYRDKVYGYLYNRTKNPHDAEDLTSCVFIKVYDKLSLFDPDKASISTWIYTITRNTLTDFFRSHGRVVPSEDDAFARIADDHMPALDQLIKGDTLEELAKALEKLPERERDVIIMRFYQDMSPQQVAERLNISNNNARHIQWAALNRLRALLKHTQVAI